MFESQKRKLGLWLLPDDESEPIREADVVALRDRVGQFSDAYATQERYLTAAHYSMFEDDLDNLLNGDDEFGVTLTYGACGHEDVVTYETELVDPNRACPDCEEDDDGES